MITQSFLPVVLAALGADQSPPSLAPLVAEPATSAAWALTAPSTKTLLADHRRQDGAFIRTGIGLATIKDANSPDEDIEFDEGYFIPLALGVTFGAEDANAFAFDIEAEGIWSDQDADDEGPIQAVSDITIIGGLLNGLADLALGEAFTIYAGGGIGAAWMDIGTESDALNDFNDEDGPFLSWQGKAGLRWWANETLSFNVGYRFLNIDDVEIDDDIGNADFDLKTRQHSLELGVGFAL